MLAAFHTVNLYIFVFMTCSTSYCDTLRILRDIGRCVSVYVCRMGWQTENSLSQLGNKLWSPVLQTVTILTKRNERTSLQFNQPL
jgi:hypothetical protein